MTNVKIFLVGGAVRDRLMGKVSNDWDFSVQADSFDAMRDWMIENNFEIFLETPQYHTIRARRKGAWNFGEFDLTNKGFDFVLARQDGEYSDGRRPDEVIPGTIFDDLARRDFTMNAMAIDEDGFVLDPFDGQSALQSQTISCVGNVTRLEEDGLRMLRAIRFAIQLDFTLSPEVFGFLSDPDNVKFIRNVSVDRIRDEMHKCFKIDTLETMYYLSLFPWLANYIFTETGLWLMPTSKSH